MERFVEDRKAFFWLRLCVDWTGSVPHWLEGNQYQYGTRLKWVRYRGERGKQEAWPDRRNCDGDGELPGEPYHTIRISIDCLETRCKEINSEFGTRSYIDSCMLLLMNCFNIR